MERQKITCFADLNAWQGGHQLVLDIYKLTKNFPREEIFGLTNQMRRAAVSITSNIAEGFSRQGKREKTQFYSIALGSLTELQNQLIISKDISYLEGDLFNSIYDSSVHVQKMLCGLVKSSMSRES